MAYYELNARIPGAGMNRTIVGCFDPTIVICRLRDTFPRVEILPRDFAWKDYNAFQARGAVENAIRIAENDARRRGPVWVFSLPLDENRTIRGAAERYRVHVRSTEPFPEPFRADFLTFLNTLRFAPYVEVSTYTSGE
jgi:hypothetical protein